MPMLMLRLLGISNRDIDGAHNCICLPHVTRFRTLNRPVKSRIRAANSRTPFFPEKDDGLTGYVNTEPHRAVIF